MFSPDGAHIVSGSGDQTVRIWDAMSGAPIGEPLQVHSDWVTSVVFSPDGAHVVSGSDHNRVQICDAMTDTPANNMAQPLQPSFTPLYTHSSNVNRISTFSSGSLLHDDGWMTLPDGRLLFWVPEVHRRGLFWPCTLIVIGAHRTQLITQRFVHGVQWAQCYTGDC